MTVRTYVRTLSGSNRECETMGRGRNKNKQNNNSSALLSEDFLTNVVLKDEKDVSIQSVSREDVIQTLWAGYGTVSCVDVRFNCSVNEGEEEEERIHSIIIKRVDAPSCGSSDSISHIRKIRSYEVEHFFYQYVVPHYADENWKVPNPYSIQRMNTNMSKFTFIMENLQPQYSDDEGSSLNTRAKVEAALRWLASFHATFWEQSDVLSKCTCNTNTSSNGGANVDVLWECGGYWHLDTRWDEYDCMTDGTLLKQCATVINDTLKAATNFQTLVHGDFKSANILFSPSKQQCAAVDFQYCGRGYGMKDVVMLVVSSIPASLFQNMGGDTGILQYYHSSLEQELLKQNKQFPFSTAMKTYELCLMDYVRFMDGWGYWGYNSSYARNKTNDILQKLFDTNKHNMHPNLSQQQIQQVFQDAYPFT